MKQSDQAKQLSDAKKAYQAIIKIEEMLSNFEAKLPIGITRDTIPTKELRVTDIHLYHVYCEAEEQVSQLRSKIYFKLWDIADQMNEDPEDVFAGAWEAPNPGRW